MLLENFLQETRYLSVVHLYFHEQKLIFFEQAKKKYSHFTSFDIEQDTKAFLGADILLIEIGDTTKEKLKQLVSIFTKHKPVISYLFANDVENKLLLKFSLHFGCTDVLPLINQEKLLHAIFTKNPNKLDEKLYLFQKTELEKKIEQFFPFFLFHGTHLAYANAKAQRLYETNDLSLIESKIHLDEELFNALETSEDTQGHITLNETSYLCIIKCFPKSNEKF
ncbi:MAG: hypothetical protein LRY68_02520 [Sulfurospirillum sp.]|nr:hypothetical protein [Sulfurospirillum sp.]